MKKTISVANCIVAGDDSRYVNVGFLKKNNLVLTALIILCLAPITYKNSEGLGISVNYVYFLLIPLINKFKFFKNTTVLIAFLVFGMCFLMSIPNNYFYIGIAPSLFWQQCISLIIFILPFFLLCLDLNDIEFSFAKALVIASFIYSLCSLVIFISIAGGNGINPFVIKELMGDVVPDWPQRYVLVLIAGFFFSMDDRLNSKFIGLVRLVILFSIFVTFLRAAYLAVVAGYFSYIYVNFKSRRFAAFGFKTAIYAVFFLVFVLLFLSFIPELLDAGLSIIDYFMGSVNSIIGERQEYNVSDQARLDMLSGALDRVNPLFGLGGGGIYFIMPDVGSSHNQYLDYYVRFGLFGLAFFVYFNYRLIAFYWKSKPWVIGVVISYLVFGVAHETTKFSYGSFIFFVLLSLTYFSDRFAAKT